MTNRQQQVPGIQTLVDYFETKKAAAGLRNYQFSLFTIMSSYTHPGKCLQKILNRFYGPVGICYRLEAPFWYLAYNEFTIILLATKSLQDGHIAIDAECI